MKLITPAQYSRIVDELTSGKVSNRAFSLDRGNRTIPSYDSEKLYAMDIGQASNVIDAMRYGHASLADLATEYGFCTRSYAEAWVQAKQERMAEIAKKNDLTKKI